MKVFTIKVLPEEYERWRAVAAKEGFRSVGAWVKAVCAGITVAERQKVVQEIVQGVPGVAVASASAGAPKGCPKHRGVEQIPGDRYCRTCRMRLEAP